MRRPEWAGTGERGQDRKPAEGVVIVRLGGVEQRLGLLLQVVEIRTYRQFAERH
jgi:hypothetical protein